jgi:hypothetical protein
VYLACYWKPGAGGPDLDRREWGSRYVEFVRHVASGGCQHRRLAAFGGPYQAEVAAPEAIVEVFRSHAQRAQRASVWGHTHSVHSMAVLGHMHVA